MKNKFLFSVLFLLLVVGLYTPASYSQLPTYQMTMNNFTNTSTTFEFDIWIQRTGSVEFQLYGIQLGITYNTAARNGGTLTAGWVPGSPDQILVNSGQVNLSFGTTTAGCIKVAPKTQGVFGNGAIIPTTPIKVGRLRVTSTTAWNAVHAGIGLSYTTVPYKTAIFGFDQTTTLNGEITNPASNINDITTLDANADLLPVELSTLTSTAQGRSVVLNWSTKTEKNSDRFEVERSLVSNSVWSVVGTVKASVLSNSTKNYTYTDSKLQSGKYQYRLKMVDNDGSFAYSVVTETEVALPKDFAVSQNYPNPFNPSTKIDYQVPVDAKVIMEVYNIAGQKVSELVNSNQTAGYYTVDFGASKLSSGVYIYRISAQENATGKNFSSIRKMMLLK